MGEVLVRHIAHSVANDLFPTLGAGWILSLVKIICLLEVLDVYSGPFLGVQDLPNETFLKLMELYLSADIMGRASRP